MSNGAGLAKESPVQSGIAAKAQGGGLALPPYQIWCDATSCALIEPASAEQREHDHDDEEEEEKAGRAIVAALVSPIAATAAEEHDEHDQDQDEVHCEPPFATASRPAF